MAVRILVVDDADVSRRMVRAMVRDTPGLSVCGEAQDGLTGVQKFDSLRPDVVVLAAIAGLAAGREGTGVIAGVDEIPQPLRRPVVPFADVEQLSGIRIGQQPSPGSGSVRSQSGVSKSSRREGWTLRVNSIGTESGQS